MRQTRPASSAASTTGCAACRARRRPAGRARAPRRHAAGRRALAAAARPATRTFASSVVVDRCRTTASAPAQATGLPPNVEPWSPGTKAPARVVGDEQAADRQAVREPLRERDELRAGRRAARRRRTCRCGRRRSAPRRRRAARRALASAAPRGTPASSGMTPPSPSTGSSRIEADVVGHAACSDVDVVRLREARARRAAARTRARFAGWPVTRERARRAAVEALLERDHAGLAGRLARVLERRLVRLGAGVAEERLRAAEALARARRASSRRRLGAVEVRRVPEPVELRVRSGERRRMPVAEPDDGDARREVEVARAGVVDEPAAVAVDERDARRADTSAAARLAAATVLMRPPPSRRSPRRRRSRAARAAAQQLRDDAALERAAVDAASRRVPASIERTSSPSWKTPGTSVRKRIRVGADADRERGRGLVGVHVQRPARERRDDRARGRPRAPSSTAGGARRQRAADEAELRAAARPRARSRRRRAAAASAPIAAQSAALTAAKLSRTTSSPRRSSRAGRRRTRPRARARSISSRDLRPGAVHDADRVPVGAQREHGLRDAAGRRRRRP